MGHCSFCSLLCSYESESELADCPLRTRRIAQLRERRASAHLLNGRESSLEEAINAARGHLQNAPAVLVTGKVFSLEVSRRTLELASSLAATIDLADSQPAFDWLQAVQSGGGFTTTINEARFRSDLMVFFGKDADFENHPRILHQLLDCPAPLRTRCLLLLGDFSTDFVSSCKAIASSYHVNEVESIQVAVSDLWRIFKAGIGPALQEYDAGVSDVVEQLQQRVEKSDNAVVVFSTKASYQNGVEVYRWLNEYIMNLASDTKVAALPLSSQTLMFSQCCTWQTGFPGRVEFADKTPRYNPWLNTADKWIGRTSGEAIVVVIDESVPESKVVIKKAAAPHEEVLVQIQVAVSGVESFATFYKADGSTMLSCGEANRLSSAGEVLEMILAND